MVQCTTNSTRWESKLMYNADEEMNELHEFMREEATAREEQDSYDTETIEMASNIHKEDY